MAEDQPPMSSMDHHSVPEPLRVGAAWAWRLIVIVLAVAGICYLLAFLSEVTIAICVAILLSALLQPVMRILRRLGLPRAAAAGIAMILGLLLVSGVITLVIATIVDQAPELIEQSTAGAQALLDWLAKGPLHVDAAQTQAWLSEAAKWLTTSQAQIATVALGIGGSVGRFLSGVGVALFALFFFLYDGRNIWNFVLKVFPASVRIKVDQATTGGWRSLSSYVKVTCVVAAVDAAGIFVGAMILGVPMAPALGALVFIGAFVPIVGAVVSGSVAVLVALVTLGWMKALIMLAVVVGVQQLESHVLQPFLMGRAVNLHPLAVILGIGVGITIGGIVGGVLVIPILAFTKSVIEGLTGTKSGDLPYQGAPVS